MPPVPTSDSTINPVQRLLIERDCTRLLLTYAGLIDSGQVDRALDLFVEEAILIGPRNAMRLDGITAIRAAFAGGSGKLLRHFVSNIMVDVVAPDRANVTANILLYTGEPAADGGLPRRDADVVIGTSTDDLILTPCGWRFQERRGALCFAPS